MNTAFAEHLRESSARGSKAIIDAPFHCSLWRTTAQSTPRMAATSPALVQDPAVTGTAVDQTHKFSHVKPKLNAISLISLVPQIAPLGHRSLAPELGPETGPGLEPEP